MAKDKNRLLGVIEIRTLKASYNIDRTIFFVIQRPNFQVVVKHKTNPSESSDNKPQPVGCREMIYVLESAKNDPNVTQIIMKKDLYDAIERQAVADGL